MHRPNAAQAIRVYIPLDTSACALGADQIAEKIRHEAAARGIAIELIRTGSRGDFSLEPLVEVATAAGRLGYANVSVADVDSLFAADFLHGGTHPLAVGKVEALPFFAQQQRLTFARVGVIDPLSLADYAVHGGWQGLRAALAQSPDEVIAAITASGLRGRGGAAFPVGVKWQTVKAATSSTNRQQKYIVCNADEGDSGTFADRMLLEGDPFSVLEGMVIAGLAVGADQGFIYVREEYPKAWKILQQAVHLATVAGYLGDDVLGSGRGFHLELRRGAGAYICGEETALLESLEGKRGQVRAKPPLPAHHGLFGQPTVVNNVLSLATVPYIMAHGAAAYAQFGTASSRGTLVLQVSGQVQHAGLVEIPFGLSLAQVLADFTPALPQQTIRAVQVGGPLGAYLPAAGLDLPLDYEAFAAAGAMLGHGGVVVFAADVDMAAMAQFAFTFCAHESCGKCTPCRIGSTRGSEVLAQIRAGKHVTANLALLQSLCDTMQHGSLCAMGGMTPAPVLSALRHFPEDFV